MSLGNLFRQVTVGCRYDAHSDLDRTCIANLDEFAGFKDTEQLGLQVESHFPDLVEEDRAVVRLFEKTFCLFQCTCKGSGLMSEHLTLQQITAERRAVDGNEGFSAPGTVLVDGLGKDFFSRPGLTCQENRHIGLGNLAGEGNRFLDGWRFANDGVKRVLLADRRGGQLALLISGGGFFHRLGDQGEYFVVIIAFGDIIESTVLDGLYAVGDIAVRRQ